jgi:hypothetical protein
MVPLTNPDWIARFVERLSTLRPSMSTSTAAALAIEAHRHEPEAEPVQSAQRFHLNHLGEPGPAVEVGSACWSTSMYDSMEHEHPGNVGGN